MAIRRHWSRLSLNQRLAFAALVLGAVALFARTEGGNVVAMDLKELATIIDKEGDHVTASELAGWLVAGRSDYRLIDLRGEREYGEYHIPSAENVTLAALPDAPLLANETIVVYSEGGLHGIQAWMLMRAKGFRRVYSLKGGLEQWKDEVLFPALAEDATPQERARFERSAAMAKFFGGTPRTGKAPAGLAELPAMPRLELPAAQPGAGAVTKRKKKEGC